MKKLIALLAMTVLTIGTSQANPSHPMMSGYHHHDHNGWIGPLVIGGALGYVLAQPRVVYVQPQPVIIPQLPLPPYGYHYESVLDANCSCYRTVLMPN